MRTPFLKSRLIALAVLFAIFAISLVGCGGFNGSVSLSNQPHTVITGIYPQYLVLNSTIYPFYQDGILVRSAPVTINGRNFRDRSDSSEHYYYVRFADADSPWSTFIASNDGDYLSGDLYIPEELLTCEELNVARELVVIDAESNERVSSVSSNAESIYLDML